MNNTSNKQKAHTEIEITDLIITDILNLCMSIVMLCYLAIKIHNMKSGVWQNENPGHRTVAFLLLCNYMINNE